MKKLLIIWLMMCMPMYPMEHDQITLSKSFGALNLNEKPKVIPSLKNLCAQKIAEEIDKDVMNHLLSENPDDQLPVDFAIPIIKHLSRDTMSTYDFINPLSCTTIDVNIKKTILERFAEDVGLFVEYQDRLMALSNREDVPAEIKNTIQTVADNFQQEENMRRFLIKRVYRNCDDFVGEKGEYTVRSIQWSPNNEYYIKESFDGSGIYDKKGRLVACIIAHCCAWSADSQYIAGLLRKKLAIYTVKDESVTVVSGVNLEKNLVCDITWSPHNEYIAVVVLANRSRYLMKICDKTGTLITQYTQEYPAMVAWSPDSLQVLIASLCNHIIRMALYDLDKSIPIKSATIHVNSHLIRSLQWHEKYILINTDAKNLLYDCHLNFLKDFDVRCVFASEKNYFTFNITDVVQLICIHQKNPIVFAAAVNFGDKPSLSPNGEQLLCDFNTYDLRPFWKLLNYQFSSKEELALIKSIAEAESMGTTKPLATSAELFCFAQIAGNDAELWPFINDSLLDLCDVRTIPVDQDAKLQTQ